MSRARETDICRIRKSGFGKRYEATKKPSYEEVQMNTFSGKGKVGFLAVFAVLLMPLLGIGTASAYEVGDKVMVVVPDLQEFPDGDAEHQFTCRAITEHAVWLVQDTSAVNNIGGYPDTAFTPKIVWGSDNELNVVDPADFADMTAEFESNVWGTVTGTCGVPEDINDDGKVMIILASIPSKFDSGGGSNTARNSMYYVNSDYNEVEGVEMELFYINIHSFSNSPTTWETAASMRMWNTANGLGHLAMCLADPMEDLWLIKGIGELMQYDCFGFTETAVGKQGLYKALDEFAKTPYIELTNAVAGTGKFDYAASRGQGFLFFMYMVQRLGTDVVTAVAQDTDHTGMESIAYAIDPNHNAETAVNDLVVPVYLDWLVCNLHNNYRSDFQGGIYMYDFLEGSSYEDWAHTKFSVAIAMSFNTYPIPGSVTPATAGKMMNGPIWAMQYVQFSDYDTNWTTYFNGQYTDGRGARNAINSRWEGKIIYCDDATGTFSAVEDLTLDDLYNGTFTLNDENTYLVLTNNNPGGASEMRWYISQDTTTPTTETAIHQNSVMSQYLTVYTALVNNETEELEGYDWVGPIFQASLGDSTTSIKMTSFYESIWTGVFTAWGSGTYQLSFSGYDSTGLMVQGLRNIAVGFADTDIFLELDYAGLFVPRGGAPTGAMVTLAETDAIGLAVESSLPIGTARGRMAGIIAGPVAIPDVNGTISFVSATNEASVYRYTDNGWVKLDSWMQNGRISASVDQDGIYALGEGIGVFAPELPAQLVLGATAPNPFSAQTAISFGLPTAGRVSVNVFDMTGRLVNTLANEEMAAANHTLVWDGTDFNGSTVGAGVYFCRLEAAGQVLTQKMLKVQ